MTSADVGTPGSGLGRNSTVGPAAPAELLAGAHLRREPDSLSLTFTAPWQSLSSGVINGGRRHARSLLLYRGDVSNGITRTVRGAARALGLPPMTVGLLSPCPVSATDIFVVQAGDIQMRIITAIGRESEPAGAIRTQVGPVVLIVLVEARLSEAAVVELAVSAGDATAGAMAGGGASDRSNGRRGDASTDAVAILWRRSGRREFHHAHRGTEIGTALERVVRSAIIGVD